MNAPVCSNDPNEVVVSLVILPLSGVADRRLPGRKQPAPFMALRQSRRIPLTSYYAILFEYVHRF
jgi:hypothetical protein